MITTRRITVIVCAGVLTLQSLAAGQVIRPVKDGTIVDGGVHGPFDGVPDFADWYFNQSSFEGSITLSRGDGGTGLDHRVVWEYNLSTVTIDPPVTATLTVTIRGARIFPLPDVDVHVYAYPADLQERLADFDAGPTSLQGSITIRPYQDPREYTLDVSGVVNTALSSGDDRVAFRFQIDPNTREDTNQAFIDAIDSDPTTKPFLTITEAAAYPGDHDADGDVDNADYLAFSDCLSDPDVAAGPGCSGFDFDNDRDVDYFDYAAFASYFTGP